MIALLSTNQEYTTDQVVDWLIRLGGSFIRINDNDIIQGKGAAGIVGRLSHQENSMFLWNRVGNLLEKEKVHVVWLRKFGFYTEADWFKTMQGKYSEAVISGLKAEYFSVLAVIVQLLSEKRWVCNYSAAKVSKYQVLQIAKQVGFDIPDTALVSNKYTLAEFHAAQQAIVSKSIREAFHSREGAGFFSMFTEMIGEQDIVEMPLSFFPSLTQAYTEKAIEIRIFYLDQQCYAMAIHSQRDSQTKIDFKKYNWDQPNRTSPFQLPQELEEKIQSFMNQLQLDTGSLDFIYTPKGAFVFLEVNPTGQFGMVSYPCNYQLEKKVAQYLIKLDQAYGQGNH